MMWCSTDAARSLSETTSLIVAYSGSPESSSRLSFAWVGTPSAAMASARPPAMVPRIPARRSESSLALRAIASAPASWPILSIQSSSLPPASSP